MVRDSFLSILDGGMTGFDFIRITLMISITKVAIAYPR
jgi:hypothetical protein